MKSNNKVKVDFPGYRIGVERELHEDRFGTYVKYQKQRVPVRPSTNSHGEYIKGFYIGTHPKLLRRQGLPVQNYLTGREG